jgi:hypothetical protein
MRFSCISCPCLVWRSIWFSRCRRHRLELCLPTTSAVVSSRRSLPYSNLPVPAVFTQHVLHARCDLQQPRHLLRHRCAPQSELKLCLHAISRLCCDRVGDSSCCLHGPPRVASSSRLRISRTFCSSLLQPRFDTLFPPLVLMLHFASLYPQARARATPAGRARRARSASRTTTAPAATVRFPFLFCSFQCCRAELIVRLLACGSRSAVVMG